MTILNQQIKEAFAKADAESIQQLPSAIVAKRKQYKDLQREGKTWMYGTKFWEDMKYGEKVQIEKAIKNIIALQESRNARIANKLIAKDITSIDLKESEIIWGNDFETIINLDQYQITLQVIYAGGHSIQELHQRVLCNVKKIK